MTSETPEAASSSWAAEHSMILDQLVRVFSMVAIGDPALRTALEQVPAWHAASASIWSAGHELSPSPVLWELVSGLQAAAANHPALARTLVRAIREPESTWSVAVRAVIDRTQWRNGPPRTEQAATAASDIERLRAQRRADRLRWARSSSASPPVPSPVSWLRTLRMRRPRE
jgi:hypothetical protein